MKRIALVLLVLVVAVACLTGCSQNTAKTSAPKETSSTGPDRAKLLVTADELSAKPDDYFVWDCRDPAAYKAGHIPGAINLPWQALASVNEGAAGDPDWGTLLPPAKIKTVLEGAGVDTSKTIVLYTDPTGWGEDGRVMWSLASVGITNTRLLDGGYPYWESKGNKASTDAVTLEPTTVEVSDTLDASLNITTDELEASYKSDQVVDARNKNEYDGATDFGEKRGGHIPTAKNLEYPSLLNVDGTLKSTAALEDLFAGVAGDKSAPTVFYCTKGIRSAYEVMVARWLGYTDARNYDASFYSWAGNADLPLEK